MSDEKSLINRYRPTELKHVLGQKAVTDSLEKIIKTKSTRAFIFESVVPGCGKTTIARILAARLGCRQAGIREIDAATNNGVDAMREIGSMIGITPLGGGSTMVILDEAHMATKAAFATLLKVVEEPPPNSYWAFCTTDVSKIPQAIRTRCACYRLAPVSKNDIYQLLGAIADEEKFSATDEVLYLLSEKADGSPRQAISFLAMCSDCKTRQEAASLLGAATHEKDVADLARAIMEGKPWPQLMDILKAMGDVAPESVRIVIVAWFSKIAMGAKSDQAVQRLMPVLEAFANPYPAGATTAHLILSLAKAL